MITVENIRQKVEQSIFWRKIYLRQLAIVQSQMKSLGVDSPVYPDLFLQEAELLVALRADVNVTKFGMVYLSIHGDDTSDLEEEITEMSKGTFRETELNLHLKETQNG